MIGNEIEKCGPDQKHINVKGDKAVNIMKTAGQLQSQWERKTFRYYHLNFIKP